MPNYTLTSLHGLSGGVAPTKLHGVYTSLTLALQDAQRQLRADIKDYERISRKMSANLTAKVAVEKLQDREFDITLLGNWQVYSGGTRFNFDVVFDSGRGLGVYYTIQEIELDQYYDSYLGND